jgi:hypothetical protein
MCNVIPAQLAPGRAQAARRRLLVVAITAWALLLVALAGYAVYRGGSTVRAQTSVAHALPTVDRAIADVVTASGSTGAVAEISGYHEVTAHCSITAVRDGARYERAAHLYVPVGQERPLLDRIAALLPGGYDPRVRSAGPDQFTADAGDFVALKADLVGPGEVRFTADTGCRPLTGPVTEATPAADRAPVQAVLAALKVSDVRWQAHQVACGRGGSVRTVRADGSTAPALDALRAGSPEAVVARSDLYAYRSGPVGIVARTHEGAVTVTSTTGCAAQ